MDMQTIEERIRQVDERVRQACAAAGVPRGAVTLLGACKTMPAETVRQAAAVPGLDAFGENRVQEFVEKNAAGAYGGLPVHMIGALQTNKVKYVAGVTALIHSVDSERLASEIDRIAEKRGVRQDVLCEVNIGMEPGKSGVSPGELPALLEQLSQRPGIRVRGLMVIPPPQESRRWFEKTRELFLRYAGGDFNILSMGMSHDYAEAIAEGATLVRVGRAIFGDRPG